MRTLPRMPRQAARRRARARRRRRRARCRAQPAPLGPNPSPGATATRCSSSRRSAVSPSGRRSHTKNVPSQTSGVRRARPRAGLVAVRTSRRGPRPIPAGPSSAAIVARCSGSKIPTRSWSFRRLMRSTISAFPTTKPMRQPAMPYVFDIDHISTPTSFAPGVARKLSGRAAVVDEVDVRGVVDDRAAGPLGPAHRVGKHAVGSAHRARVRRVVEIERRGRVDSSRCGAQPASAWSGNVSSRAPANAGPDG